MSPQPAGPASSPGKRLPAAVRYGLAVLLAAAAQAARLPLHPPTLIPFITFVPFILLSAFLAGWGPGVLATFLCMLESIYFGTAPVETLHMRNPHVWPGVGALAVTGLVASALFERLRQARLAAASHLQARSEMAAELEARRRVLESVFEHSPVAIALLRGSDFRYEMVNPAHQALASGVPMLGRSVSEVWPEVAATVLPLLREVRDKGTVYHTDGMELPLRRGAGLPPEERYFQFSYVPLAAGKVPAQEDPQGQVLVVAMEVTDVWRTQQELRRTLRELEQTLAEKTVLVQEIHHRVKNNLAVIVGLLGMKAAAMEGTEAQNALEDSQHRVRSIAMIHEQLSGTDHMDRIDFAEYAGELVRELGGIYDVAGRRIAVRVETGPIKMNIQRAVPCALILNELLTNSLRHAFPNGRAGEIRVSLREAAEAGKLELTVEDDGIGCAPTVAARPGKSLGLRIVGILTRQLEGSLEQPACEKGARFVLRFRAGSEPE